MRTLKISLYIVHVHEICISVSLHRAIRVVRRAWDVHHRGRVPYGKYTHASSRVETRIVYTPYTSIILSSTRLVKKKIENKSDKKVVVSTFRKFDLEYIILFY